jgi:hypothetical protein
MLASASAAFGLSGSSQVAYTILHIGSLLVPEWRARPFRKWSEPVPVLEGALADNTSNAARGLSVAEQRTG